MLTAWMLLIVVWVVPFHLYGLSTAQLKKIMYDEPFFRLVYVAVVISTLGCILPRMTRALRRSLMTPSASSNPRPASDAVIREAPFDAEEAEAALLGEGYKHVVVGHGWVWAVANRYSPVGNVLFHLGVLLLMVAFTISNLAGSEKTVSQVLAAGENYTPPATGGSVAQSETVAVPAFKVDSVSPEFYKDILLFTRLESILDVAGRKRVVTLARPWHPDIWTTVALGDFGYAPQITHVSGDTTPVTSVYKLKVFPPGSSDTLNITLPDNRNYRLEVNIQSDYVDRRGRPGSRSFNLSNPRVMVSAWRVLTNDVEKIRVERKLLRIGEPLHFDDVNIKVDAIRYYGVFKFSRSRSAPWFASAFTIIFLGLAMRLLSPRRQALLVSSGDSTAISVIMDTYRAAGVYAARIAKALDEESGQ